MQISALKEENQLLLGELQRLREVDEEDKLLHLRRVIQGLEDRMEQMFESKKQLVQEYNILKGKYL
jgi:hypothetical protein